MHFRTLGACAVFIGVLGVSSKVLAHGYAGDRFFPPTITTDDPFAADELALPTVTAIKGDDGKLVSVGFELDKLIFPNLSIGVGETHDFIHPDGGKQTNGWENLELNLKYNAYVNEPHEFILALGLESEIGGTGTRRIGRDSVSTVQPTLYFGKGFGDLPDSLGALKPFVVTGVVGQSFPTGGGDPNTLEWGFSLQYQLPYLQSHVKDIGLPKPFKDMIPLVEFAFSTPENRGGGETTGTINPGVLYETKWAQFGVEAIIPVNRASGTHVGVVFQTWIFLDDLMPKLFGHPVFGGGK
jgi:hypothetical protein